MITNMTRRFKIGDRLDSAFVVDPMRSEMRCTPLGSAARRTRGRS
jgi:hypothetical protein